MSPWSGGAPARAAAGRHRDDPATRRAGRDAARRVLVAAVPIALAAAATWLGAFSAFTDTVSARSTLATGTIDVTANGSSATPYAWSALDTSGMLPGSVRYAPLTIANAGTAPLTWSMAAPTVTGSTTLAAAMTIGISRTASATCASSADFTGGTLLFAETTGLTTATVGSRTLAAGGSDVLCFKVTLPASAPSSLQGLSTVPTFVVSATS